MTTRAEAYQSHETPQVPQSTCVDFARRRRQAERHKCTRVRALPRRELCLSRLNACFVLPACIANLAYVTKPRNSCPLPLSGTTIVPPVDSLPSRCSKLCSVESQRAAGLRVGYFSRSVTNVPTTIRVVENRKWNHCLCLTVNYRVSRLDRTTLGWSRQSMIWAGCSNETAWQIS